MATRHTKQLPPRPADAIVQPKSHFSWSTYATTTHNLRGSTPPSPPPPLPEKPSQTPRGPQMQSILSRSRPIQRQDREDPPPPPYAAKLSAVPRNPAPKSAKPANSASAAPPPRNDSLPNIPARKPPSTHSTTNSQDKSTKPLPAPPISPGATPITHLDHLLLAQTSLLTQRSNLERAIAETRKVELASPLEVPFAHVRDAKRKKEAFEKRLEGILLEEQEVGIKVSRARRREEREEGFGEGEALWVRRVTG